MTERRLPRGIRNHNPGNIRRTNTTWRGMSADQSGDPAFIVFQEPLWGLRALGRLLRTYYDIYHCRTVAAIIDRYAPPSENDTASYVAGVSRALGVDPADKLPRDTETWAKLMQAIVLHENGQGDWYQKQLYNEAADLALS